MDAHIEGILYGATYLGHGQSKTTFLLKWLTSCRSTSSEMQAAPFHDMVLKVARRLDPEPRTFDAIAHLCVATKILYRARGREYHRQKDSGWHCWVTERTTPLDEFLALPGAKKSQCVLAVVDCLVRCASEGLRVSDCAFFNLGVLRGPTEDAVVLIDAGSYEVMPPLAKNIINTKILGKVWKEAAVRNIDVSALRDKWRNLATTREFLEWARTERTGDPLLCDRCATEQAINRDAAEQAANCAARETPAYQILRFAMCNVSAHEEELDFACCRALKTSASPWKDDAVIEELWSRLQRSTDDSKVVVQFWWEIGQYRKWVLAPRANGELDGPAQGEVLDERQVTECVNWWKDQFYWYYATPKQKLQSHDECRRTAMAGLHRKCVWKPLAYAIWEIGLPEVPEDFSVAGTPDRSRMLVDCASDFVDWLYRFAVAIVSHRGSEKYAESKRVTGHERGESGLNDGDRKRKQAFNRACWNLVRGRRLDEEDYQASRCYRARERFRAQDAMATWECSLLRQFRDGTLHAERHRCMGLETRCEPIRIGTLRCY
jgi:hypothetical protein